MKTEISKLKGYVKNKEIYGHVYVITNLINNRQYIGRSKLIINSTSENKYLGGGTVLNEDIKKCGKINFSKQIIHVCYDLKTLLAWEMIYKRKYDSFIPKGYNVLRCREDIPPCTDPIIAAKMAINKKGKNLGSDNPNYGNKWTKKQKKHLSKKQKERIKKMSLEERIEKLTRTHSEEQKISHGKVMVEKWKTIEYRKNRGLFI